VSGEVPKETQEKHIILVMFLWMKSLMMKLAELAEYVQKCIYNFVKEQQLYDSILQKNPVPTNANFFKKVDAFIKELL